jgi:hypothetical protein
VVELRCIFAQLKPAKLCQERADPPELTLANILAGFGRSVEVFALQREKSLTFSACWSKPYGDIAETGL